MTKLFEKLKTPDNTDALKQLYKENGLVYYTPLEELINTLTHGIGAVFALVFMIFMLIRATTPQAYATAVVASLLIAVEFSISATYHAMTDLHKKLVWRKIDFPAVNLNVIACAAASCLMYNVVFGYIALGVSLAITIAIFALCQWRFDIFRRVSVASTFVIGAIMFAAFFFAFNSNIAMPSGVEYIYLAGLISCLAGAALFGVHKRYAHCIFHVFVLIGPILFLIATYLQIVNL